MFKFYFVLLTTSFLLNQQLFSTDLRSDANPLSELNHQPATELDVRICKMNLLLQDRPKIRRVFRIIDDEGNEVDTLNSSFSSDSFFENPDLMMNVDFSFEEADLYWDSDASYYGNFSDSWNFSDKGFFAELKIDTTFFLDNVRSAKCYHDHLSNMLVCEVYLDISSQSSYWSFWTFMSSSSSFSSESSLSLKYYEAITILEAIYKWVLEIAMKTIHHSIENQLKVVIKFEKTATINLNDLLKWNEDEVNDFFYLTPVPEGIFVTWDRGIPYYNEEEILENI